MPAQDKHEGSALTGRAASKRQSRHPAKFMFIDSSNGGVNAKPDRVVRSFVMKAARHSKSWSTRPKSPKEEEHIAPRPLKSSARQPDGQNDRNLALATWDTQDYRKDSLWDSSSPQSPASSRNGSVFSPYSSSHTCDSPSSGYTSPFSEHSYPDGAYFPIEDTQLALRDGFDVGFTKSFDCLSVHLDTHARQLLHQFVEGSAPRFLPVDLYRSSLSTATDWIAGCIQSPSGAPYIYASLTASARAVGLNSEGYKWRAITEVNKLLSDPRTSTNDTTIAAVLVLLALEESDLADPRRQGCDREWSLSVNDAHLNGLRTMIDQRGGLAALSSNYCLQVFILMHSIAQCITTFKRPYALLLNPMGQIDDYIPVSQPPTPWSPLPTCIQNLDLDPTLTNILQSVHLYNADLTSWYTTNPPTTPLNPFDLQKHASLLTYRLFDFYQRGADAALAGAPLQTPLDQSICLAHLLYVVLVAEPHAQAFGSRLARTVAKLRDALQRTPPQHWARAPDLWLWTLTVGALGARGLSRAQGSEFAFFAQYAQRGFATASASVGLSAEELLGRVYACVWIPGVLDERARRVWAHMGLCAAEGSVVYDSSSEEEEGVVDDEYAVGHSTTARFFPAVREGARRGTSK